MFKGNKIYYITAVTLVFWFIAADYGLMVSGYWYKRIWKNDLFYSNYMHNRLYWWLLYRMETPKPYVTITATATATGTFPGGSRNNNWRSRGNRNSSSDNSKKIRGLEPRFFIARKKALCNIYLLPLHIAPHLIFTFINSCNSYALMLRVLRVAQFPILAKFKGVFFV